MQSSGSDPVAPATEVYRIQEQRLMPMLSERRVQIQQKYPLLPC